MRKLLTLSLLLISFISNAQDWNTGGNPITSGNEYVGCDGTRTAPLQIKTVPNQQIQFYVWDTLRGVVDSTTGFWGIGKNFVAPQSLLHQHTPDSGFGGNLGNYHQFTNRMTTATSANRGFSIGNEISNYLYGVNPGDNVQAMIRQHENSPMKFYTDDTLRMIINARVSSATINGVNVNTTAFVGINGSNRGDIFDESAAFNPGPRSLLHLQGAILAPFTTGGKGWRSWMRTGTYMNENSDELYIGLKNEFDINGPNRSDAVLVWGDDQFDFGDNNADNFRIIFSGGVQGAVGPDHNPRSPFNFSGLETVRITPLGLMGIGPLFTWSTPPSRRLEVLDYQDTSGHSFHNPQLRLTFEQAGAANLLTTGRWTDFQTTNLGDLYIHPHTDSAITENRFVGINQPLPNNTLELESELTTNAGAPNSGARLMAGLRFTRLTSATSPAENIPAHGRVLTVDSAGEVGLTDDQGGVGFGACNTLPLLTGSVGLNLNNHNLFYQGQSASNDKIFVGYPCGSSHWGKLCVKESAATGAASSGGYFENNGTTAVNNLGVYGISIHTCGVGYNIGVEGSAQGGRQVFGVVGRASFGSISNYGVYGDAGTCGPCAPPGGGCAGCGCSRAAGYFNGNVLTSAGNFLLSDSSLKDSVQVLTNALATINQLNPKTFVYKNSSYPSISMPAGRHNGLLAQQVGGVLPGLVDSFIAPHPFDTLGIMDTTIAAVPFLALNYTELIPILIGGEKELSLTLDTLRGRLPGTCDAPVTLTEHLVMDLDTSNIYYRGQNNNGKGRIGIGYNCLEAMPAKFSVQEAAGEVDAPTMAGYFHNGDTASQSIAGVKIEVDGLPMDGETGDGVAFGLFVKMVPQEGTAATTGILNLINGTTTNAHGAIITVAPNLIPGEGSDPQSTGLTIWNLPDCTGSPDAVNTFGAFIYSHGYEIEESSNGWNVGLWSNATTGNVVVGVDAYAANGTNTNIGVSGISYGGGSDANYGIYGKADIGTCSTSTCVDAAIFCDGDFAMTGTPYLVSDAKLKENVKPLENSLSILNRLSPKSYTFKTKDFPTVSLPKTEQNGLIAQEVAQVLPNLVKSFKVLPPVDSATHRYDPSKIVDVMAVNYNGIIPILIQGIKDQQQELDSMKQAQALALDSLRSQLAELNDAIKSCCAQSRSINSNPDNSNQQGFNNVRRSIDVNLSNVNSIVLALDQNFPNPFAEKTTLAYSVPAEVAKAMIIFYDNLGRVLQSVTINERGAGQLNVFAGNLSSGIYSYSLIADGKVIDTKKMVCDK